MVQKTTKKIPPAQVLIWVIEGAIDSLVWLRKLEIEWQECRKKNKDGSQIRKQQRIVSDAFTMYIASLFDSRGGTHSFLRSYLPHPFIKDFESHKLVRACLMHRNNRAGHQSEKYGFVVSQDDIIASDLDSWLKEAYYAVSTGKLSIRSEKSKRNPVRGGSK